ncbi:MAG: hypothetical protein V3S46_00485 [Nitrospinota bacterium]
MARAKVIAPVPEKPDWYTVEDDLGKRYDVLSALPGYGFKIGRMYRLLVPGGMYITCKFRLLSYQTGKRWTDVGEFSKTRPASAAFLFLNRDNLAEDPHSDAAKKVKEVFSDRLTFEGGGCARIAEDDVTEYAIGSCVGVIYDQKPPTSEGKCPKTAKGAVPTVAGFGPCPEESGDGESECPVLYEYFSNYNPPMADYINGEKLGYHYFIKERPRANEITNWTIRGDFIYQKEGFPYGEQASVWMGDWLRIDSNPFEIYPADSEERDALRSRYPRTVYMPRNNQSSPVVLSPPVIAKTSVNMDMACTGSGGTGDTHLKMTVNLLTDDTEGHYANEDGYGTGLQLPGCMILVFNKRPYPAYLDGSTINKDLFSYEKFSSVKECNMDMNFKLVYAAPALLTDFSEIRQANPLGSGNGQYALLTAVPRRTPAGSYWAVNTAYEKARYKFNVPMSDPYISFWNCGFLLMRCFDYDGIDVTPAPPASTTGGAFPGFFEISRQNSITRNLYDDFMAAYPFMKNPLINPNMDLPRLSEVYFYLQGKVFRDEDSKWYPNPTKLECQRLEFFYEKQKE